MDASLEEALKHIHPDRAAALCSEAERVACRAALFLDEIFKQLNPTVPAAQRIFPRSFLLNLCTGVWLLYWEDHGISIHVEAGLPPAMQVLSETFAGFRPNDDADRWSRAVQLAYNVTWLFAEHIAWHGHAEVGGEFVVGEVNEDVLLESLAQLLWHHRHALAPEPRGATQ
jgi:hypothetical protein